MIPPLFVWASASAEVKALLGEDPVRFWPFANSPQKGEPLYGLPYAAWSLSYGSPDNYLGAAPDADNAGIRIACYGRTPTEALSIMTTLRSVFEPHGYVEAYDGESKDPSTGLYVESFVMEFWTDR